VAICVCACRWVSVLFQLCLSPVCAILGGQASQEIIRAVSGKEPPSGNVFVLDVRRHGQGRFAWVDRDTTE
jgi:hypothetical protein